MTVAFGPTEPTHTRQTRDTYWTHRAWVDALETRIMMTDAGLAFLGRVKRIGRMALKEAG